MALKLTLELSDADLQYYRDVMEKTWQRHARREEKELVEGVRRLLSQRQDSDAPEYVRKRLDDLSMLISMLGDVEWPLEPRHRKRIVVAVSYFAEPQDMIPDQIPGLGYLDDALMAELVIGELKHELDAYRDFCKYRDSQEKRRGAKAHTSREQWLAAKRRQLFARMEDRRGRRRRHGSVTDPADLPILRYEW